MKAQFAFAFIAVAALSLAKATRAGLAPLHDETSGVARNVDPTEWLTYAERNTREWWEQLTASVNASDDSSSSASEARLAHGAQEFLAAAGSSSGASAQQKAGDVRNPRPNYIVVIVDDMDKEMGSLEYMPKVKKYLRDAGTEFVNHFVTASVCCPSRMSLLTGMFAHNTNFTDVVAPGGGWERYFSLGLTDISLPKFLKDEGYSTAFFGKLVNAYLPRNWGLTPPGWDIFDSLWMYNFFQPVFARNGDRMTFYPKMHQSDVIAGKATQAIQDAAAKRRQKKKEGVDAPFFLYVAPTACHTELHFKDRPFPDPPVPFHPAKFMELLMGNMGDTGVFSGPGVGDQQPDPNMLFMPGVSVVTTEAVPADRHKHLYPDAKVPRTPNFNPDVQDKPGWIGKLPKITDQAEFDRFDHWYRQRIRTLASVDDMVEDIVKTLEKEGELENTYILFTSDNGWHLGLHRLGGGKLTPYEHDIRVPMVVRGPGVPKGKKSEDVTTHTDIAPTLLKLAGAKIPEYFDGAPMPLHNDDQPKLEAFGVEYWSAALDEYRSQVVRDNNYKSVRYLSKAGRNYLYSVRCAEHEREFYDLSTDPYELRNAVRDPKYAKLIDRLDALLNVLRACQGKECREPWKRYHPDGSVKSIDDALDPKYDAKYASIPKITFRACEPVHNLFREGLADSWDATVRTPDKKRIKAAKLKTIKELAADGWRDGPVEAQGQDMKMIKFQPRM